MDKYLTKTDAEQFIKDYFIRQGGAAGTSATSLHAHTGGGDGVQIQSDSLLPYTILNTSNNGVLFNATNSPSQLGSIKLFDYTNNEYDVGKTSYNWGMVVKLGNDGIDGSGNIRAIWSYLNLADFFLSIHQFVPQSIAMGGNTTIIFDGGTLEADGWFPSDAYNVTTGQFSVVQNGHGKTQSYLGWDFPGWYMVSASVGLASENGTVVAGESVDINVYINGVLFYWNRFYFPSPTDIVIATINVPIMESAIGGSAIESEIHIEITNNTSDSLTTNIAGIDDITWFKIKQLK